MTYIKLTRMNSTSVIPSRLTDWLLDNAILDKGFTRIVTSHSALSRLLESLTKNRIWYLPNFVSPAIVIPPESASRWNWGGGVDNHENDLSSKSQSSASVAYTRPTFISNSWPWENLDLVFRSVIALCSVPRWNECDSPYRNRLVRKKGKIRTL